MKEIAAAIMTKFNADTNFKNAVGSKLYHTIVPQDKKFPYASFMFVSETNEYQFDSSFENALVQFDIFDDNASPDNIETTFSYLKTLFDWCVLSVSGYTHVYMRRESARLFWEDTEKVFHRSVDYRVYVRKV